MEKKYIMAQINIPIEVLSNGQTQPYIRCAQIEFLPCDKLPPEHENPNQFIMEKMSAWLGGDNKNNNNKNTSIVSSSNNNIPEESLPNGTFSVDAVGGKLTNDVGRSPESFDVLVSLFVSKEDIERTVKARGQTITFKNYSKAIRSHNMTEKKR